MRPLVLPLLLVAAFRVEAADPVTVYRCTDGAGHVSLRDTPCPKGQREQAIDMQRPVDPEPRPVVVQAAPTPAGPPVVGHTRVVFVEAPRALFQCTTPDGERYTSDTGDGNPRWVPLWTLGYPAYWPRNPLGDRVGALPPPPPGTGPGAPDYPALAGVVTLPGTWIRDRCVPLPQAAACETLRAEQRALRKEWFNAMPSRRAEVAEEERVLADRVARTCGT